MNWVKYILFSLSLLASSLSWAESQALTCEDYFKSPELLEALSSKLSMADFIEKMKKEFNIRESDQVSEAQFQLLDVLGQQKVAPFYEAKETTWYLIDGEKVSLEHISAESAEELRLAVLDFFTHWASLIYKLENRRELNDEEKINKALITQAAKKVKSQTWFNKKAVQFSFFAEGSDNFEVGEMAQVIMAESLFKSKDILNSEKLKAGEVELLKQPWKWPKRLRKFVADRAKKTYTSKVIFWTPMLIIYVKWGDGILAWLDAVLN